MKGLSQALKQAGKTGWLDVEGELPRCYGKLYQHELVNRCDECPLHNHCKKENDWRLRQGWT